MNKLKTFRQMHKISQKELANVLCTTQQQISLYETGRRKLDEDQIAEICKVYKINPEEILENTKGESYMTKAQEIVLKIGEYIQEKDGKITFSEILEEYTKLPAPERTTSLVQVLHLLVTLQQVRRSLWVSSLSTHRART